jgi:hypothetical protein
VRAVEENRQSVCELAVETVNKEPLSKHKLSLILSTQVGAQSRYWNKNIIKVLKRKLYSITVF